MINSIFSVHVQKFIGQKPSPILLYVVYGSYDTEFDSCDKGYKAENIYYMDIVFLIN